MSHKLAQQTLTKGNRKSPPAIKNTTTPTSRHLNISPFEAPLVQRSSSCACGGGCPRCSNNTPIQAKLRIGRPGDKYEQEADRIADQIMRMPEPGLQREPT
jgi:hypothetical protein